ncbi:reverse transcriptase domain-containing protein [Tanacetum coccineum]
MWMSPPQDSREYVSHATPPPDTKQGYRLSPRVKIQAVLSGADLYLNKLAPQTSFLPKKKMAGPIEGGGPEGTDDREETPPPLTKEQIEGHVSALKSLIKSHNRKNKGDPIRLDFEMVDTEVHGHNVVKGKEVTDEDLRKPFKESRRTPFTRRIIKFAGELPMHVWCRMFQQTLDGSARGWFERLPRDSINEWADLREAFAARFSVRRACFKEPHEITKIIRKANESLTTFKERWTMETDKVPATVNEMMERLDDFVWSEEAYASTELLKGETGESHRKISHPFNGRDTRPFRNARPVESGEYNHRAAPVLTLDSLTKHLKEILATETQLRLPVPRPMLNPLRSGNTDRYCDYHQEKDHYTNDCIQLRKQLEITLESRKLNHLVKDVRQRGRGSNGRGDPQPAKIINVISVNSVKDKKRKVREATESWMNIPISFLTISSEDIYEEPLIIEEEAEGYLVRQVYVDEGSSVECRRLEKKQMIEEESLDREGEMAVTEEVLINPSFLDQLVTIGGRLSEAGKGQLKCLLKDNIGVFAWEPSDMTGVPRWVIEYALNVNPSLDPVCQKRRMFSKEKSGVVTNEVAE